MGDLLRSEKNCLNCGAEVSDKYCSHCGQKNVRTEVNAFSALGHLVADYFHADGKFFSTIPPLLFRPGRLTREFMAGRRKTYVDPFRLYIFCSILYFLLGALVSSLRHPVVRQDDPSVHRQTEPLHADSLTTYSLARTEEEDDGINLNFTLPGNELPASIEAYDDSLAKLSPDDRPGFFFDQVLRQMIRINSKNGDWEKEFNHKLLNSIPKMMFFLIPVAALILKFLYWRKRKYYLEHLVFQLHLHSFFFLFMLFGLLLDTILPLVWAVELLFLVWILLYPLLAFKRNYGQNWFWTAFKYVFFLVLYGFSIVAGLAITAIITSYTT
ncbi:MAG: DUF3667 domain-containing protein [Candidatus Pollutiaquabacter aromativorans]|jgi:hypothetical protein|uniref:DUF3667 domain-containing protein n=1 Tax=Candidatus Pollutiaquabacter sp. TaxID=3416354 RepID=UPI003BF6D3D5|nr:DUF3667 domain-containing protein [Bacteroidota bacterium]